MPGQHIKRNSLKDQVIQIDSVPHEVPWGGVAENLSEELAHALCLAFLLCGKLPEDVADKTVRNIKETDAFVLMFACLLVLL